MAITVEFERTHANGRAYLTWAPVRATLRSSGADAPLTVTVANADLTTGGQLEFAAQRDAARTATLTLTVPVEGTVDVWVAGTVGRPSTADGDAVLVVTGTDGAELARVGTMVRVRKNANALTAAERDLFLLALATLNDQGQGLFRGFREMHKETLALAQAHDNGGFLPWHRAYLLDLERELQRVKPAVALPYWRFDQPAPNVFSADFMGAFDGVGLTFGPQNLLRQWQTDGGPGIRRTPRADVVTVGATGLSQGSTLNLGGPGRVFDNGLDDPATCFTVLEGNPHGSAHTSFGGGSDIRSRDTAPRDPLFFLLHCNVDRLWAGWQWLFGRYDAAQPETYFYRGAAGQPGATLKGHNLSDTLWPWDGDTSPPRPGNAPRHPFLLSDTAAATRDTPTVRDMIDYQGFLDAGHDLNFAYAGIPYGVAPPPN